MTVHELENILSEYSPDTIVSVWDINCCFHVEPQVTEFKNESTKKVFEILLS